jgi:hypothetical protein
MQLFIAPITRNLILAKCRGDDCSHREWGCQFALLRLTLPIGSSIAVMTGNLTNVVLALVNSGSRTQPLTVC